MSEDNINFSEVLKQIRKERGLSQQELADRSVELLLESMDTDCAPKHIQLETELIQGASVKHIS